MREIELQDAKAGLSVVVDDAPQGDPMRAEGDQLNAIYQRLRRLHGSVRQRRLRPSRFSDEVEKRIKTPAADMKMIEQRLKAA